LARGVGVLDAQDHRPAALSGHQPVEERGARVPKMERARGRGREADARHGRPRSLTRAEAWQAIPSPRPSAPRPSRVVALTATLAASMPKAAAVARHMAGTWSRSRGRSQRTVRSRLTGSKPEARTS